MLLWGWTECTPPGPRPNYEELFTLYEPAPDCANRDRHIRYLESLKRRSVRSGDDAEEYNQALEIYIQRLEHYCQ